MPFQPQLSSRAERYGPGHEGPYDPYGDDPYGDHAPRHTHHGPDHRYGHHASLEERRRRPETERRQANHTRKIGGYTLGHGGRQVRLGPVAFWIIVGTLVIMGGWSAVTATYFAFHDDIITRLLARQAEMQFAYEDRIAEMRAQVDRVTSRQLLDQEQFEQRLAQVQKRQAALESRASALNALVDPGGTGSIKAPPNARMIPIPDTGRPKPSPISDTVIFTVPAERHARLESRTPPALPAGLGRVATAGGIEGALARLQHALDRVERKQSSVLGALEENYDAKVHRIKGVLADIGLKPGKAASDSAVGGPFVPYRLSTNANAFERQLHRINLAHAQVDRLTRMLAAVPIRKPVMGEIDTSSTYGVRIDPFLGRPAMHTGLDFRGNIGDPIRATASGTVTSAGWSGGYGKLVEIDHGNGVATRYGHLSEIEVHVGQSIKIGQVIGRLGSTGRSTGPHLHYETRVEGDAVDPQKFLRAGIRLGSIQ